MDSYIGDGDPAAEPELEAERSGVTIRRGPGPGEEILEVSANGLTALLRVCWAEAKDGTRYLRGVDVEFRDTGGRSLELEDLPKEVRQVLHRLHGCAGPNRLAWADILRGVLLGVPEKAIDHVLFPPKHILAWQEICQREVERIRNSPVPPGGYVEAIYEEVELREDGSLVIWARSPLGTRLEHRVPAGEWVWRWEAEGVRPS